MREVLLAFGRGLLKVVTSLCVGTGVGLVLIGYLTRGKDDIWSNRNPPAELFLAIGAWLLTAGGIMLLLFGLSWLRGRPPQLDRREDWSFKEPRAGAGRQE